MTLDTEKELEIVQDLARIAKSVWEEIDFQDIDSSRDMRDEFVNAIEDAAAVGTILDYPDELAREMDVRSLSGNSKAHRIAEEYGGESRRVLRIARKRPRLVFLEMEEL